MAEYDRQTLGARAGSAAAVDEGLRSYMLRVYNYMGVGLIVTGLAAWFAATAAITTKADRQRRGKGIQCPIRTSSEDPNRVLSRRVEVVVVLDIGKQRVRAAITPVVRANAVG